VAHLVFQSVITSSSRILLFPGKEAKSVCSASQKTVGCSNLGEADPGGLGACPQKNSTVNGFFFSRKEAKALVLLRRMLGLTQTSAKPTLGVWGRAPSASRGYGYCIASQSYAFCFFFWKKKDLAGVVGFMAKEDRGKVWLFKACVYGPNFVK
jgi:hypothetical protein